jgi:DNA-directed RNA polymerase specialized sigma subunit
MQFIIDEKIYDTDKSELICEYAKPCIVKNIFMEMKINRKAKLYRTQKGNWFSAIEGDSDKLFAEKETEDYVKNIFRHNGAVELYNKYFTELEEA